MLQYRSIAKTMNGKAPKRCRQKRVLMIPAHYRIKASDAFGPGSPHRLRWHERRSREVAPADTKTEYALVAQSDSAPTLKVVGAPDAEGVARAQTKARTSGNVPLREVSPPILQLDILCTRGAIG